LIDPEELVERIWGRDPTVWTGQDEAQWLGWLDEPRLMGERLPDLARLGGMAEDVDGFVLLGMGGSSLAPEVLRRLFGADSFRVLDTTHPKAIRRVEEEFDLRRTLFVVSSKSGTTLETRSQFDHFWERSKGRAKFVVVTDPGSKLEQLAKDREAPVFPGEPTIGGRYSALSLFGLVPAALMGIDVARLLEETERIVDACHGGDDNPGLELGLELGNGWQDGRDTVGLTSNPGGFGLWVEQLLAESTGKQGKGLIPAPDDPNAAQRHDVEISDPYDVGPEFFRWEFATGVAGSILGINPFDQPNVQEAKDRTNAILESGKAPDVDPEGSVDELLQQARPGENYVCIQAFIDPAREADLDPLIARARATGCVVTHGLGPRYLHSTGQLHKGGPPKGVFLQVVDDTGQEVPIPGKKFGFGKLIRAQAAGDYAALKERGRPVARVRLEEIA
jgi:transaldolase/glucose-6-phosphate isomerase